MKRANEIREQLNAAIASGSKEQMFNFALKCKGSLSYCSRAPRVNALKHAIDCVVELMGAAWVVEEPTWVGTPSHLKLDYKLRREAGKLLFDKKSSEELVAKLNARKRAGSATHAYAIKVADYIGY